MVIPITFVNTVSFNFYGENLMTKLSQGFFCIKLCQSLVGSECRITISSRIKSVKNFQLQY